MPNPGGRLTVLSLGVVLLATSAYGLVHLAAAGVWAVLALLAVAVAVVVLPTASGVERQVRPVLPRDRDG